jgi:hypothetical protein
MMAAPAVARRLTPARRLKLFQYYEAELLTDLWIFVGRRRDDAAADIAYRESFRVSVHPDTYREGLCYLVPIPFGINPARYALYENGRPLAHPDSLHEDIRRLGDGRYSIWGHTLYFSTSGNADPLKTRAIYELRPAAAS